MESKKEYRCRVSAKAYATIRALAKKQKTSMSAIVDQLLGKKK